MNKLKPCPFCGAEVPDNYINITHIEKLNLWHVCHYCEHEDDDLGVCLSAYGKTKEIAIERWNHRAEDEKSESL